MRLFDYITEATEIETVKVLILIGHRDDENTEDLRKTGKVIKNICIKRNIPYYPVFSDRAYIRKDSNNNTYIHNINDKKGFKIDKDNTVCIIRGTFVNFKSSLDLITQLEKNDIYCINSRETIETCADKFRTILRLADLGIVAPKTVLVNCESMLESAFKRMKGTFPCILKTLTGSKGVGVFKADSWEGMRSTLQTIWKINPDTEIIIQEYIEADYDMRIHVLGGKVIAAMKRYKIKKDFRSNYSLGGKVEKISLTEEQAEVAIRAAKAVAGIWVGVDMMIDRKGNIFVIEVNSSPGTEGIIKATGKPIVDIVLDYATDKKHWRTKTIECGYIEKIKIEKIGDFEAKFDTGNSSYCVLHADEWKINDSIVTWSNNGKTYKNELQGMKIVKAGTLGIKEPEERPVIFLDVTFNGTIYKDIKFTLSKRDGRKPANMNVGFIKKAGLSINPAKKYLLSVKEPIET